jgi:hypothetical protein
MIDIVWLISRKVELSLTKNVTDLRAYAQNWANLAASFEVCGLAWNAQDCRTRAVHYAQMADGFTAVKVVE